MLQHLLIALPVLLTVLAEAQPYGIDHRVPNTSLLINELPADTPGTMQLIPAFGGVGFTEGVFLAEVPDGSNRLCVVEKAGVLKIFPNRPDLVPAQVSTFLDISGRVRNNNEQGLLGLAFDPDYASNGRFYLYYSWRRSGCSTCPSRISRFTNAVPGSNTVVGGTEEVLLLVEQPYSNHNGGMITFGPDGMFYIGLGDGGSGGDPLNSGQDTTTLLGSILRIDVRGMPDPGLAYRIPRDNPFYHGGPAGLATRKEIYAYGLRNPWRFSFDPLTGRMFAGDVGQNAWEEVDVIIPGGNYGWRYREGRHCYNPPSNCPTQGLIDPIAEYGRDLGASVTGGYVYSGYAVPELYGAYLYADYVSGRIWSLRYDGTDVTSGPTVLVDSAGFPISSFGQTLDGEVYVIGFAFGAPRGIYALRPAVPVSGSFPRRLSEIPALWNAGAGLDQTAAGILPYRPSAELWSDGARKERFVALPYLTQAGFRLAGGWDFGEGSLIVKNFLLPMDERNPEQSLKRIETRLLLKKNNQWHGFSYEWNEEETDAVLLPGSKSRAFSITNTQGQPVSYTWQYPSRAQCLACHTTASNGVLGLQTPQMNHPFRYPLSGVTDNQLRTLEHIEWFNTPLPAAPDDLPRMPDPADTSVPLASRARAYLAANCAQCHQPGGPAPTNLDLRWETPDPALNAIDVPAQNGDLGIAGAKVIARGDPERSVLLVRMRQRGVSTQMPPLATSRIDEAAVALVRQWIEGLGDDSSLLNLR